MANQRIRVDGSVNGPIIQGGRDVKVTNSFTQARTTEVRDRLVAEIAALRAQLDKHTSDTPAHRMTDRALSGMAKSLATPVPRSVVGEVWDDLLPHLSTLAGAMSGASSLGSHLATITAGIGELPERA